MKKSFFLLVFAAFIGFAANAQNQKTTTSSTTGSTAPTAKPATTTTAKPATTTTQTAAPKEALKVPSAVETAFKAKYANTTPTWSMKGSDYQAKFKANNEEMKANFDASGKWIQTETKIASTSLPANVQSSIKAGFADFKTESAAKLQSATTGSGYCATVAKGTEKYDVVFGTDGKVVSKTKM